MKPSSTLTKTSKTVLETAVLSAAMSSFLHATAKKGPLSHLHSSLSILRIFTPIILLTLLPTGTVWAQVGKSSVTQTLTIEVKPITSLSVTGNPSPLIINGAVPGSGLLAVSDENTKYSLTTNLDNMKIVASINNRMPAGTKLMVKLSSSKAASMGLIDLSGALSPVDVVTGLRKASDVNQSISYTFAANPDVYEIPNQTRVVTLTLTN
jgi:hypothetical protein